MHEESPSALRRVVTSLKVIAVATVLGTVVMAAERHLVARVSPEAGVATDVAPARTGAPAADAPSTYFPSQFAEPTGEPAEQPATF